MGEVYGKKVWLFPDGEMPPAGNYNCKGHEAIMILNMGKQEAKITLTLYFQNADPVRDISITVGAERVRCLRLDNPADIGGYSIEKETQYAMSFISDVPVAMQYGRLDTRDQPMHFYTNTGYFE